ncbi:MAG: type II/IV secretion system protein [Planctomycetes bacterium]|nr:type II/IV secretion system protein [Planctomycetota bacterium]NOG54673.1 type II/IV secretion system protein [Planctomycetota bacterium]
MLHDGSEFLERALVEEGLIKQQQLEEARALAEEASCSLDDAIVTLGFVDGRRIALTKAQICEAPFADVTRFEINQKNCSCIPRAVAEQHNVFPLFVFDNVVTLGTTDPLNIAALDQVRQIVKRDVDAVQCEAKPLRELISRAYSLSSGVTEESASDSDDGKATRGSSDHDEETGPIVAAVNTLLSDAIAVGASDIHLNPDQHDLVLRFRVDGVLQKRQGPPLSMHPKLVQRFKVMSQLDLTQTRRPQDGKFRFHHGDRTVDVRVSILPTITGENVVLRLLNTQTSILSFRDLGLPTDAIERLDMVLKQPYGMFLVTGPTGSGKTTTLYTALSKMNTPDRNIMTIEDPVEVRLPLIRQIQVNADINLTFATALRSILRQDPDVILVGEIRDLETATIALQASLTGHFVLSTLHTNDAPSAVARLRDFGLPPFVINSALLGVMAQRLVRRVCEHCSQPAEIDPVLARYFQIEDQSGFIEGKGCGRCLQSGFKGRLGVYELMQVDPGVQRAVAEGLPTEHIRKASIEGGMRLMWQDGLEKAQLGLTTLSEVSKMVSVTAIEEVTEPMLKESA